MSFHFIGRHDLLFKPPTTTRRDVTVQQNRMVVEMEGQLGVSLVALGQELLSESQS